MTETITEEQELSTALDNFVNNRSTIFTQNLAKHLELRISFNGNFIVNHLGENVLETTDPNMAAEVYMRLL